MSDELVPYDFPRRLIRKMSTEDARTFARATREIEVERVRITGKAWNTELAMERTEYLAGLAESLIHGTDNPIAQEAYKQYLVEFVITAKREISRQPTSRRLAA